MTHLMAEMTERKILLPLFNIYWLRYESAWCLEYLTCLSSSMLSSGTMRSEEIGLERSHELLSIDAYYCSINTYLFYSFFFPSFRVNELVYALMGYPHIWIIWILLLEHTRDDIWTPSFLSLEVQENILEYLWILEGLSPRCYFPACMILAICPPWSIYIVRCLFLFEGIFTLGIYHRVPGYLTSDRWWRTT